MRFEKGDQFGDLTIEREIGAGAFGTVYAAHDELLHRRVALKVLRSTGGEVGAEQRARVLGEARLVGRLQSPWIATLYRVHELPNRGGWALELEFVDGVSLAQKLEERGRIGVGEAMRIFAGLTEALAAAHGAGIVHGDVKPGNIVLGRDGSIKVVDFGIARMMGDTSHEQRLITEALGTPIYMAPEVVMGDPPVPASDIWSAGVVLYRMVAGILPFRTGSLKELLPSILNDVPPPLPTDVAPQITPLIVRTLGKDPKTRPAADAKFRAEIAKRTVAAAREERRRTLVADGPALLPGRDEELRAFADQLDEVRQGGARSVLIEGAVGYGVSTLLATATAMAEAAQFRVLRVTPSPLAGVLRVLHEESRRVLAESDLRKLDTDMRGILEGETESAPRVMLGAVEALLQTLLAEGPTLLAVDDAQHAEGPDRRVLRELARRCSGRPFLLLMGRQTRKADEAPYFPPETPCTTIPLGPLPAEAIDVLLTDLGGGVPPDAELVSRIVRTTEGSPLFAAELFRHLKQSNAIVERNGTMRLRPGEGSAVPARLEQLVAHRLDTLTPEQREIIDVAAVDGLDFDAAAVVAVLDVPLLSVLRQLQRLYRDHDIVVPTERGYRFRHSLMRDAIYEAIDASLRTEIHRGLAAHLESRDEEILAERIGVHWEKAGNPKNAAPHLRRAMVHAARAHDLYRGLDFAERAGLLREPLDPDVIEHDTYAWRTMTNLLAAAARFDDIQRVYRDILSHPFTRADPRRRLEAMVQRARQLRHTEHHADLQLDEIERLCADQPPDALASWAHVCLGHEAKYKNHTTDAIRHFTRAVEIGREIDSVEPIVPAATGLAGVLESVGRDMEAEKLYREAADRCIREGHRGKGAIHLINHALCSYRRGELAGTADSTRRAMVSIALEGAPGTHGHAGLALADMLYAEGKTEEAERQAASSMALVRERNLWDAIASHATTMAAFSIARGDLDAAAAVLAEGRDGAQRVDNRVLPVILAADVQRLWLAGERDAAARAVEEFEALLPEATQTNILAQALPWLAESVLYGMPAEALEPLCARLRELAPSHERRFMDTLALANGAIAFRDPCGSIADLREAGERMRHPAIGDRQALLRILGLWLEAEAWLRSGDDSAARELATDALARARRLGHVWLEADLDRFVRNT